MVEFGSQSAVVAFGTNLFLTVYILVKRRGWRTTLNRSFSLLSFSFALWNLGIVLNSHYFFMPGILLVTPATYLFLLVLLRYRALQEVRLSIGLWISSGLLIITYFLLAFSLKHTHVLEYLFKILAFLYIFPIVIWGAIHLINRIRLTSSRQEKFRLMYVLIGMIAAALGGVTAMLPLLGFQTVSYGALGGLIYTGFITVAIMRHRLFDFGRLAGRAFVIFVFTFLFWFLTGILGDWYLDTPYTPIMSLLVAVFVLVALYEPLKAIVEGQADRVLGTESLKFTQELQSFSREMGHLISEEDLIRGLARTLRSANRVKSFGIYLYDRFDRRLILKEGDDIRWPVGTAIETPKALMDTMRYRRGYVSQSQVAMELRSGLPDSLKHRRSGLYRNLLRLRAQLCFPLFFAEHFLGFLTLGFQDPETDLTRREDDMLNAVTLQIAASITHARVIEMEKYKEHLIALGKFASGLAHEVRNPLATIKAAVQYLEPLELDPTHQEFFTMITDEVDRLNRFVERFLSYARPVSSDGSVQKEQFGKLINRLIKGFRARARDFPVEFSSEIDSDAADLKISDDAWTQILSNLITNAVQALEESGIIRISAGIPENSQTLIVHVDDSGPGIAEKDMNLLFQPFFTTREKGTGLGLAIVHQIVQNLHGEITVSQSDLGGTRFTISQPLSDDEQDEEVTGNDQAGIENSPVISDEKQELR